MGFRSKVDGSFILLLGLTLLIVAVAIYHPLWLDEATDVHDVLGLTVFFLATVGFILWCTFSVKYVFHDDHLFVKGGPFRSRIPYQQITKVAPTRNVFTGYRLLSSFDAIEIFYEKGLLGSVKISPKERKKFLNELQKRCPHIRIKS